MVFKNKRRSELFCEAIKQDNRKNEIINNATELMIYVIGKYDVKSYDDFTCPHHKKLAKSLKLLE